ncbi:MAG TPA: MlaD family protein [Thermodesulfovibrionales bacterium]|nr:MlaD family protein [Thermodesulfovibrionales bacterium]
MSKKTNKTLIGAFVVGAIALVVAGVLIFGSGKFLRKTMQYVMFFDASVKGLQVGAPVTFRGVKIGEVTDIALRFDPQTLSVVTPVYVEIDPEKFSGISEQKKTKPYQYYRALLDKGLKARLELQSFVTGLLMIGVDFYPEKPIRLVGLDKKYHEIPTIPTQMEELQKTIQNLPLKEITENLNRTLAGINEIVRSPELHGSLESLNQTLKSVDKLVKNIDTQIGPLTASLTSTSDAARGTFAQAEKTLAFKEGVPGEIASSIKDTLKAARLALEETQQAVRGVKEITAQNANLGYEINRSAEQMTALSRSLRSLTDYIDRHPEAFIKGKNPSKGE